MHPQRFPTAQVVRPDEEPEPPERMPPWHWILCLVLTGVILLAGFIVSMTGGGPADPLSSKPGDPLFSLKVWSAVGVGVVGCYILARCVDGITRR